MADPVGDIIGDYRAFVAQQHDRLLARGIDIRGYPLSHLAFRVPEFKAVHAELARREIICDSRPDVGLRFGPHFFTTDDEIRYAVGQVVEMLDTGAHLERATTAAGY